MIIRFSVHIY